MVMSDDLDEQCSNFSEKCWRGVGKFTGEGSGLMENCISLLEVNILKNVVLARSSIYRYTDNIEKK